MRSILSLKQPCHRTATTVPWSSTLLDFHFPFLSSIPNDMTAAWGHYSRYAVSLEVTVFHDVNSAYLTGSLTPPTFGMWYLEECIGFLSWLWFSNARFPCCTQETSKGNTSWHWCVIVFTHSSSVLPFSHRTVCLGNSYTWTWLILVWTKMLLWILPHHWNTHTHVQWQINVSQKTN